MGVFKQVREVIVSNTGYNDEDITLETHLKDDFDFDSLDMVEILMEIEQTFNIEIPDEDAEKAKTVGDIVSYIKENT